jgi:MFS family permease
MEQSARSVDGGAPVTAIISPRRLFTRRAVAVTAHYTTFSAGYFGIMSVLVLSSSRAGVPAHTIAIGMVVLTVAAKVGKIPLSFVLDRIPANLSILVGCLAAGAATIAIPHVEGFALLSVLAALGIAISVNGLASKQAAADASDALRSRETLFAVVNVGVNVASAITAPLALLILDEGGRVTTFTCLGALYATAGVVGGSILRAPGPRAVRPRGFFAAYGSVLRTPQVATLLLINAFGWFFYAQLFGSLPIVVSQQHDAAVLGVLIAINAATIITLQVPVSAVLRRALGDRPDRWIATGIVLFAASFAVAASWPTLPGLIIMVVLFSLGEASFVPAVDVELVRLVDPTLRATGFAVVSSSTAVGESLGSAIGITVATAFADSAPGWGLWAALTGAAVVSAGVCIAVSVRRRPNGDVQVRVARV